MCIVPQEATPNLAKILQKCSIPARKPMDLPNAFSRLASLWTGDRCLVFRSSLLPGNWLKMISWARFCQGLLLSHLAFHRPYHRRHQRFPDNGCLYYKYFQSMSKATPIQREIAVYSALEPASLTCPLLLCLAIEELMAGAGPSKLKNPEPLLLDNLPALKSNAISMAPQVNNNLQSLHSLA